MRDDTRRRAYLAALGVDAWIRRDAPPRAAASPPAAESAAAATPDAAPVARADAPEAWAALAGEVSACVRCALHEGRTQTVFGVGDRAAGWLIVGEAPGQEEDRRGEPFVGRAGQLLNAMLAAVGLARERVYIANILKCRPPNNRDPRPEEVACCEPFLARQIALIAPRIILAVGRIAAQNLLKVQTPIGRLRGQRHHYGPREIPVVVTYHPAYLLRSPAEKRRAWQDLLFARQVFEGQS
ncbi:MAG: uracil-DNA glycosylase family protein [Gammaproteobacteria bacterium]